MVVKAVFGAVVLALCSSLAQAETPDAVARRYGLSGELLVSKGQRVLLDRGYGVLEPGGRARHKAGERWRLASITKQITAALLLRDHLGSLDQPVPAAPTLTLRQLLTHHSGLANPDATPRNSDGVPSFYTAEAPDTRYCLTLPGKPGSAFSYNNCDYLVAGALLGARPSWPAGLTMARGSAAGVPGFIAGKPEPMVHVSSYGAAGGLVGTARAVFDFDRSLMTGTLLAAPALSVMWRSEGNGSAQALGQWVFTAPLKGCAAATRIVQRDGEISGVQARNFILPDLDMTVIVFSNRSSDDFALGEVWQREGFVYDLLSAAACAVPVARKRTVG